MKVRKKWFLLTGLASCAAALIVLLFANNWSVYGLEKYFFHQEKVPGKEIVHTESGIDAVVKNGKFVNSKSEVFASTDGSLAVVHDREKGMLIIDQQGQVVDHLDDLKAGMAQYIVEKPHETMRHVGNQLMAGQIVGDTLYYFSTYESTKAETSLWAMNLQTREFNKLLDSEKYGMLAYVSATDEKIVVANHASPYRTIIEYFHNHEIVEHVIYGTQVNKANSPDSTKLAYRPNKNDIESEKNIKFYEFATKTDHELPLDQDTFYNHGGVWGPSGNKFAFISYHYSDSNKFSLAVYNFETKGLTIIPSPDGKSFKPADYNLQFINDKVIEVPLIGGDSVHITIN